MKAKSKKLEPLEPPDPKRCQTLRPNGFSFMTFGGVPGHVRCGNKPIVIAYELKPGKDGRKGSMSLCGHCMNKMQIAMPGRCSFEAIIPDVPA